MCCISCHGMLQTLSPIKRCPKSTFLIMQHAIVTSCPNLWGHVVFHDWGFILNIFLRWPLLFSILEWSPDPGSLGCLDMKKPQIYVFQPQFPLVKPLVLELYQYEGTENDSLTHNRLSSGVFLIFEATVCCILLHTVFFPHASDIPWSGRLATPLSELR